MRSKIELLILILIVATFVLFLLTKSNNNKNKLINNTKELIEMIKFPESQHGIGTKSHNVVKYKIYFDDYESFIKYVPYNMIVELINITKKQYKSLESFSALNNLTNIISLEYDWGLIDPEEINMLVCHTLKKFQNEGETCFYNKQEKNQMTLWITNSLETLFYIKENDKTSFSNDQKTVIANSMLYLVNSNRIDQIIYSFIFEHFTVELLKNGNQKLITNAIKSLKIKMLSNNRRMIGQYTKLYKTLNSI